MNGWIKSVKDQTFDFSLSIPPPKAIEGKENKPIFRVYLVLHFKNGLLVDKYVVDDR